MWNPCPTRAPCSFDFVRGQHGGDVRFGFRVASARISADDLAPRCRDVWTQSLRAEGACCSDGVAIPGHPHPPYIEARSGDRVVVRLHSDAGTAEYWVNNRSAGCVFSGIPRGQALTPILFLQVNTEVRACMR